MSWYIGQYVSTCNLCLRTKLLHCPPTGELYPLPVPEEQWDTISVITPGYIEELDDEGRLGDNDYLHYEVTDEERDGMGEMCDPYGGL